MSVRVEDIPQACKYWWTTYGSRARTLCNLLRDHLHTACRCLAHIDLNIAVLCLVHSTVMGVFCQINTDLYCTINILTLKGLCSGWYIECNPSNLRFLYAVLMWCYSYYFCLWTFIASVYCQSCQQTWLVFIYLYLYIWYYLPNIIYWHFNNCYMLILIITSYMYMYR